MDAEFAKWFTTLGVGGALAVFMFFFYRKDVKQYTELWRLQTDALMSLVRENTRETVKLTVVIEALHRRLDRTDLKA